MGGSTTKAKRGMRTTGRKSTTGASDRASRKSTTNDKGIATKKASRARTY